MNSSLPVSHAEVRVDLGAIRDNVARLRACAPESDLMAVVKADAYGHGLIPCARAALAGGASWLGTAVLPEAVALRQAGIGGRILCWLNAPGDRFQEAISADVDVSAYAPWAVEAIAAAAEEVGRPARLHLKVDTGLGRGGATIADWPNLVDTALAAQADGALRIVGLFTHFAYADAPNHPTTMRQGEHFREAVSWAERRGVRPEVRHLANSAATLTHPEMHADLVRPGIAVYGLSPIPEQASAASLGLRPAMSVRARLALVKSVAAGAGVSYGHDYRTSRRTRLGLVPLGYADGIPRHAGSKAPLMVNGVRLRIAGRVCMDQFVVDLGDTSAEEGDEVVLFGSGEEGEPTAEDWAIAAETISYEIVTRISTRLPRRYVDGEPDWAAPVGDVTTAARPSVGPEPGRPGQGERATSDLRGEAGGPRMSSDRR